MVLKLRSEIVGFGIRVTENWGWDQGLVEECLGWGWDQGRVTLCFGWNEVAEKKKNQEKKTNSKLTVFLFLTLNSLINQTARSVCISLNSTYVYLPIHITRKKNLLSLFQINSFQTQHKIAVLEHWHTNWPSFPTVLSQSGFTIKGTLLAPRLLRETGSAVQRRRSSQSQTFPTDHIKTSGNIVGILRWFSLLTAILTTYNDLISFFYMEVIQPKEIYEQTFILSSERPGNLPRPCKCHHHGVMTHKLLMWPIKI